MSVNTLLKHVSRECKKAGVRLQLVNTPSITSVGEPCLGLFSCHDRTLTVAVSDPNWVWTLAHEYGHLAQAVGDEFRQSLDPKKLEELSKEPDPTYVLDLWFQKRLELPKPALMEVIKEVIACELDAERTASDLLSNYGLADPNLYARRANGVLYAYGDAVKTRKFNNATDELMGLVPGYLLATPDEYLDVPKEVSRVLRRKPR